MEMKNICCFCFIEGNGSRGWLSCFCGGVVCELVCIEDVFLIFVGFVGLSFIFGINWFCGIVVLCFVVVVMIFEVCVVLFWGFIKDLEEIEGVFDVFCDFWEEFFMVCDEEICGVWDKFLIMWWGFFVIGVIIVFMFCKDKGKLKVVEIGIFEVEVEVGVLDDKVVGVVVVFIEDIVGFIVVEDCKYISVSFWNIK